MPGISFDRAADYYDATRGFAEGTAERIRDAIAAHTGATAATRFLELGVGTGRIALPFIVAGYNFTGVDISWSMMERLRQKLDGDPSVQPGRYRLIRADVTRLPFADAIFDVVYSVHVLHLVDDWRLVLREARRVLRQGGWLLSGGSEYRSGGGPLAPQQVRQTWDTILKGLGVERESHPERPASLDPRIAEYLRELGATVTTVELVAYETPPLSARGMADRLRARMYSGDWTLPDEVHAEALGRLDRWLDEECPQPDTPVTTPSRFSAIVARWGE